MKITPLLFLAALLPLSAVAQNLDDPYRDDQARMATAEYAKASGEALDTVRFLYFAAGCHVVASESELLGIKSDALDSALRRGVELRVANPDFIYQRSAAAEQDGRKKAQEPGACNFWHEHPEEVQAIRAAVARSMRF